MKKIVVSKLMVVLFFALGLITSINIKAQCATYTVNTNADANGDLLSTSFCSTLTLTNPAAHVMGYHGQFTEIGNSSNTFSVVTQYTNNIDASLCLNSLNHNTCYLAELIVTDSTDNNCSQSVYSNTICVILPTPICPTVTLNTNLLNGVLTDPNGIFQYTLTTTPTVPAYQLYFQIQQNQNALTYNFCNYYYDGGTEIDVFPYVNQDSLFNGSYTCFFNYNDNASLTSCSDTILHFTVANPNTPTLTTVQAFGINSQYNNVCQGGIFQSPTTSNNIYAIVCNMLPTDSVQIMIKWPSPLDTQIYSLSYSSNGFYSINIENLINQYSSNFSPGSYTLLAKLIHPNGSLYNLANNVVDSFQFNLIIYPCGNLGGTVFIDDDNNCTKNGSEQGHLYLSVIATNSSGFSYEVWTDNFGQYNFYSIPADTYTLQYVTSNNLGYSVTCTNSLPQTVTIVSNTITTRDFALTCPPTHDYSAIGLNINGNVFKGLFPGQNSTIWPLINTNFMCPQTLTATFKLVLDPCVSYNASATYTNYILPDNYIPAQTGDTAIWYNLTQNSFNGNLYPNLVLPVTTCTTAQVGDTACFTLIVLPITGDAYPSNNVLTICREIGVSYDPNNKLVYPPGRTALGNIPPNSTELQYTINFQNTGSAPAWNVYLLDTISSNLDISTLKVLHSSHSMQPIRLNNNVIKFNFPNIMLADSTNNEPESHGHVVYSIKLKPNLPLGTQIRNTAYIYFDYNEPVVTNTTLNTLALVTGTQENKISNNLSIYPNPTTNKVFVNSSIAIKCFEVFDITGRLVLSEKINIVTKQISIPFNSIDNGTYLIRITDAFDTVYSQKIIKLFSN